MKDWKKDCHRCTVLFLSHEHVSDSLLLLLWVLSTLLIHIQLGLSQSIHPTTPQQWRMLLDYCGIRIFSRLASTEEHGYIYGVNTICSSAIHRIMKVFLHFQDLSNHRKSRVKGRRRDRHQMVHIQGSAYSIGIQSLSLSPEVLLESGKTTE